jgi:hypothetical protein
MQGSVRRHYFTKKKGNRHITKQVVAMNKEKSFFSSPQGIIAQNLVRFKSTAETSNSNDEKKENNNNVNNNNGNGTGEDFILASLVESGFITGSIKTVFERGKQDSFQKNLDQFIERQKSEIQHLCNENYEEFLNSVSQLKVVRKDANNMKMKIIELDRKVQEAGKAALESGKKLLTYRTIGENVESAMELVDVCRYVASLSAKAHRQIQEKKFYGTLVTLDELERSIRRVHGFQFAHFLEKMIPKFKLRIKTVVESEFNTWLSNSRNESQKIGMKMMSYFQYLKEEAADADMSTDSDKMMQKFQFNEHTIHIQDIFDEISFDLTPVYTCKHIFETMQLFTFKAYYKRNREIQLDYEIGSPSLETDNIEKMKQWLEKIVGFFTIEDAMLHSTSELLSNVELNAMWEKARIAVVSRVNILLANYSDYNGDVQNLNSFLEVKQLITIFCYTVSKGPLRHDASPLLEALVNSRKIYHHNLLVPHSCKLLEDKIIKNEEFVPLTMNSTESDEYKQCVKFGLVPNDKKQGGVFVRGASKQNSNNPIVVPFSRTVLVIFMILDKFVSSYNQYCRHIISKASYLIDLKNALCDMLEFINQSIEKLFRSYMNSEKNSDDMIRMSQYAQIVVNIQYIIDCTLKYFAPLIGSRMEGFVIRYQQSRERGDDMILKIIMGKLASIVNTSISTVDWAPIVDSNASSQVLLSADNITEHQFVVQIIQFLQNANQLLQNIGKDKREYIMFKAFDHVVLLFNENILTSPEVVHELNNLSIKAISKDIEYMLKSIRNDFKVEKYQYCFTELKALIDFLILSNINEQLLVEGDQSYETGFIDSFSKISTSNQQLGRLGAVISKMKMHYFEKNKRAKNNLSLKDGIKEITGLKLMGKLISKKKK